jgi:hypothetical protein
MADMLNPDLKLGRAKIHLDALDFQLGKFQKVDSYRITTKEYPERGLYGIAVEVLEEVPFPVAFCAGEFICCLRSCLDYLAWQLALLNTETPSRELCFPICGQNTVDTQVRIAKQTFGISDAAIAVMKSVQPYHSGDAYKLNRLWQLNALCNLDKHRRISLHSTISDEIIAVPKGIKVEIQEFDKGAMMTVPLSAKDEVKLNPRANIEILFGDKKEGVVVNRQVLGEMYQLVRDELFPKFVGFFS